MKNLQKLFTVLTVGATLLALVGCSTMKDETVKEDEQIIETDDNQIANPWSEVDSIVEAKAITGFDFTVPESIDGKSQSLIQVMNDEMIEVRYGDDIIVRKSKGSDDNSGDFNSYDVSDDVSVNGVDVSIDQSGNNILVRFVYDDYSYSLSSNYLDGDQMLEFVKEIVE